MSNARWRLGVVSYLNALPLYHALARRGEVELVRELPANLAERLDTGACDAALLPIVDHLRGHGAGLLSNAIIGATGEVRSVLLFSKVPFEAIATVATDRSSHTSVALLRVLLRDLYGITPQFVEARPDLEAMLTSADAALIIGDPALEAERGELHVLDLAEGWLRLTGLPFVFAAWTARAELQDPEALARALEAARDEGLRLVPEIARDNPTGIYIAETAIQSYLTEAIQFTMTDAHLAAIEEFRRRVGADL